MLRRFLNRPIKRPDLWALHVRCVACNWHTTPTGPCRLRDVLWPIESCPDCRQPVVMVLPDCPYCLKPQTSPSAAPSTLDHVAGTVRMLRLPRSLAQALWGHFTCRHCGEVFDKWGRKTEDA